MTKRIAKDIFGNEEVVRLKSSRKEQIVESGDQLYKVSFEELEDGSYLYNTEKIERVTEE